MSIKILVIVDSSAERLAINNMLSEYCVLTVYNSLEAVSIVDEHPDIDLAILDLTMPDNEGLQVLLALNQNKKVKSLRTIILTKHDERYMEIKGIELGATDYIRKPLHLNSFKVRLNTHIELLKIRRSYEQELRENSLKYENLFQKVPVGIAISFLKEPLLKSENKLISINPMYEKITGRRKKELLALGWSAITHPDDSKEELKKFNQLKSGEINGYSMEKRYIRPDGSIVWVDMAVARLDSEPDKRFNHICIIQDITNRKSIEKVLLESERSKSVLLASLPGLAYRCNYDRNWTMQFVSDGSYDLTGYKPESFINNRDLSYNELTAPEYRKFLWLEWGKKLAERLAFQSEYEIITKTGQRKWVLEMGQGVYDEYGNVEALEGIVLDITDRKELELQQKYLIEHDTLTGLYNRNYFEGLLANDLKSNANRKRELLNVNLSKIDLLTISYGFRYSQALIKKVALALSSLCTAKCQLFSTYINRLTFYIHDYNNKIALILLYNEIEKILASVLLVERIDAGIGIIELGDKDTDAKLILKNLLIASEDALNNPDQRYGYSFFDKEMELRISHQVKIKLALERIATGEEEIYVQYQPILDIKTNRIVAFEALARIATEELGIIAPSEFISFAEESKLIIPIGRSVLRNTLKFLNKLIAVGKNSISVSINVSAVQLLDKFATEVSELLNDMGVGPEKLIIEITESVFSNKFSELNKTIDKLKAIGVRIAIDDFGTGYSSFSRSQELDVNYLKIDKYFIDKLNSLKPEKAIVGDIISMAHRLGHYVVAEGVEHEVQLNYLREYGCDMAQGYLISKPIDEDEAIELLKIYR